MEALVERGRERPGEVPGKIPFQMPLSLITNTTWTYMTSNLQEIINNKNKHE
jgi:hypothetical protein